MPDPTPAAAPTPAAPPAAAPATPPAPAAAAPAAPAVATPPVPPAPAAGTPTPSLVNAPPSDATPQSLLTAEPPAPEDGTAPPPAPVELDIKPPEGITLDEKKFQEFKQFAQSSKITQETAQKILDMYGENLREVARLQQNAWATQVAEWAKSAKDDPEFGQQNLSASLGTARKAMNKYGTKDFKAILDASGLGNHPEVIRFMVRVGKSLAEDSVTGATAGQPTNQMSDEDKLLRTLYPTMFKDNKE